MADRLIGPVGAGQEQGVLRDQRRAGRLRDPSPDLVALMRAPSVAALQRVALYDASGASGASEASGGLARDAGEIDLGQFLRFGMAFAFCAASWVVVVRAVLRLWG